MLSNQTPGLAAIDRLEGHLLSHPDSQIVKVIPPIHVRWDDIPVLRTMLKALHHPIQIHQRVLANLSKDPQSRLQTGQIPEQLVTRGSFQARHVQNNDLCLQEMQRNRPPNQLHQI